MQKVAIVAWLVDANKEKMKKKTWVYLTIAILILGGISYLIAKPSPPGKYDAFATCLTEKGVKMYGTDWCHFCQDQKKKFGKSFKYVDYVNCDTNQKECNSAGVEGYPTWVINGESYSGVQSLKYLSTLTKCDLEANEENTPCDGDSNSSGTSCPLV